MELLVTLGTAAGLFILFAVLEAALNRGMPAESMGWVQEQPRHFRSTFSCGMCSW